MKKVYSAEAHLRKFLTFHKISYQETFISSVTLMAQFDCIAIVKFCKGGNIPGMDLSINRETVRHIAKLARVRLDEEELEKFFEQFSRILEFFDELDKIDVSGVEPMYHVIPLENVFRDYPGEM